MTGILLRRRSLMTAVSPASGYLNALSIQPIAALSLRKLISSATLAVRVRRASDNIEQDIGFSGDALDTTALLAFAAGSSCYVTTVYDQTGNGENLIQATATKQPRIVNAGTYDGLIKWDGSNDSMMISSLTLSQPQLGMYADGIFPTSPDARIFIESTSDWNSGPFAFIFYALGSAFEAGMSAATAANHKVVRYASALLGTRKVLSVLYDRTALAANGIKAWINSVATSGAIVNPFNFEMTGNFVSNNVYVGGRGGTSLYTAPQLFSLVFYDADTSAIRAEIEGVITPA